MERVLDGYAVEIASQVLRHGSWGAADCEWDWNSEYHYFTTYNDADRYFDKQKPKYGDDYPVIRILHCRMTFCGGNMVGCDIGNTVKEYAVDSGNTVVWTH